MAIWTLTEEKAQKLLNDVKDKEQEIDILTRKTPRDLWTNDLDEFIALWRHQLEEDERLAQGRPKLKKSKPRKKKGDDDSEDDYDATLAAKRKKAPPKKQSTLLFMPVEKAEKKPARAATKKPTIVHDDDALDDVFEMIEQAAPKKSQPKAKLKVEKPTKPKVMELDDDDLDMIGSAAQPCKDDNGDSFMTAEEVPTPKKPAAEIGSDGDSDFDILEPKGKKTVPKVIGNKTAGKAKAGIAKAALKSKPGVNDESSIFDFNEDDPAPKQRSKRTAVKKPILDDDSENDNLGDVSMLVKGVGDESVVSSRPLFAASSKGASKTAAAKKPVPKSTTKAFEFLDSDDEDSDELSKPPAKTKPKPLDLDSEDEDELPKPIVRKTAPKKLAPAKKTTLAKKPAPVKPATKARGKKIQDSDDDEMDIDKEVDQLLSDSEMEDAPVSKAPAKPKPAPKAAAKKPEPAVELSPPPRARAGRGRAAAAKPVVYKIVGSDEEEEDESEEDYGDEEDDD